MYNGGERTRAVDFVVIHHNATTSKEADIGTWVVGSGAYTSAHYEIANNEIIGTLGENYVAYHAGGTGGSDVPTISDINNRSIGLEFLNSTGAPDWEVSDETLRSGAKLLADICERYGLPIDRSVIKLHREITATACPGGLDIDKLIQYAREEAGVIGSDNVEESDAIKKFKQDGGAFTLFKPFKVDEVKWIYGMWQAISYEMTGGTGNWYNNGIPLALVSRTDGGDNMNITPGATVKLDPEYNIGTIDAYDAFTNGIYIIWGGNYDGTWFDADAVMSH
ncbi:BlyA [Weissella kandleri]|uniref:N-acetylmuramoyl-L-alanine amidase n=2 Tax=Weissella kandleri TaxID=1616 RepID=A0A0R2JEB3_9LACO|nr:BlyA [Weissella kandleri]